MSTGRSTSIPASSALPRCSASIARTDGSGCSICASPTTSISRSFPDAVGERAPAPESNGLNHICLTVADLDDVVRQLGARAVPLSRPLKLGPDGNRQAWIEDPDGNRIELMEMAADGLQAQAIERLRRR